MPVSNLYPDQSTRSNAGRDVEDLPLAHISIVQLLSGILRHRYVVLRTALACALVAIAWGALRPDVYSSFAALMPQTSRPSSTLSGLATQFGLNLPVSDPGQSPTFYLELIESARILSLLAESRFADPDKPGATRPLLEILEAKGATPAARVNDAVLILRRRIDTNVRPKTGVVDVAVRTRDPNLSAAICTRLLELLNQFNLETRQSQAAAEARFVQGRLTDATSSLRVAEQRLQSFLERNRGFVPSSELSFQEDRLRREVILAQQIVTTLSQSYEQARIDQVRDTPAITIVERPTPPAEPDRRRYFRRALVGLLVGLMLGVLVAWTRDLWTSLRTRPEPEVEDLQLLVDESAADLRRPWRFVTRLFLPKRKSV